MFTTFAIALTVASTTTSRLLLLLHVAAAVVVAVDMMVPLDLAKGTARPGAPRKQHHSQQLRLPRKSGVLEEAPHFGLSTWRRKSSGFGVEREGSGVWDESLGFGVLCSTPTEADAPGSSANTTAPSRLALSGPSFIEKALA